MSEIKYLFPKFLENVEEFRRTQAFWKTLCHAVLKEQSVQSDWEKWHSLLYGNGTENMSGNPIHTLVNRKKKRGIRIIQSEINEDDIKIRAWINTFDKGYNEIDELIIQCELSLDTKCKCEQLLREWIGWGALPHSFDSVINKVLGW